MARTWKIRTDEWIRRRISFFYQDSIIHRVFGIDDRVKDLQDSPAGMFFYNQRAVFFGISGLSLILTSGIAAWSRAEKRVYTAILIMAGSWVAGVIITLGLHPSFRSRLRNWAQSGVPSKLPPLFGTYFLLDFCLVFLMIIIGEKRFDLNLDVFAFLLIANTIVYSAYVGGGRGFSLWVPGVLYLLLVSTFLLFPVPQVSMIKGPPVWFNSFLYLGPLTSMLLVSAISVTVISWLRSAEHQTTQRQLELLGSYESLLAGAVIEKRSSRRTEPGNDFSELQFRKHVDDVLQNLCSHKSIFWFDSACMWVIKRHQDRGELLLPGPNVNFPEAETCKNGIDGATGFLSTDDVITVNSMKYRRGKLRTIKPRFRSDVDAPAAFVPLRRHGRRIGMLSLYGKEGGPPPQRQDKAFLQSLGSIISNTMEQWEGRFRAFPQREMNELFKCLTLDEVFDQVVVILQRYLRAAACEVIFRPSARSQQMTVVAALGFSGNRIGIEYVSGRGKTGECTEKGITIRVDDVLNHRGEGFDSEYFESLEQAYGRPILSWMVIPIGSKAQNHGLIKVVNRTFPSAWFTEEDQALGEDLALRLGVIIEKFLYIKETEDARGVAERRAQHNKLLAQQASAAQKKAEVAARQRQMDLMTMTHQLQGPLNPVVGALSGIQMLPLPKGVLEEVEFAKALTESCLTLCWGTSAVFAKEAGQTISFVSQPIDAPAEMRKLCNMLQLTNTDNELTFRYREDPDFPSLQIDPSVFTSVLFSLIHNAMKYAERDSTVYLECTFERPAGEAALKVKSVGVRIYPDERERIFEPFQRGKAVSNTNLKYNGTGLGLWVAKQLMLSIGGDLTVELPPEYPDLSIFIVHVPGGSQGSQMS